MKKCIFIVSCEKTRAEVQAMVSGRISGDGFPVLLADEIPGAFEGILCFCAKSSDDYDNELKIKNSLYLKHGSFAQICWMEGSQPRYCLSRTDPIAYVNKLKKFEPNMFDATSIKKMEKTEIQDNIFLDGLCDKGGQIVVAGAGGIGKSSMVNQIALTVASGGMLFDLFEVRDACNVLIVQAENSFSASKKRFNLICAANDKFSAVKGNVCTLTMHNTTQVQINAKIDNEEFQKNLKEIMGSEKIGLVIIDPWSSFNPGSENSNENVRQVLEDFQQNVCRKPDVTMLLVHHTSKTGSMRGASSLEDWAETILIMKETDEVAEGGGEIISITHAKCRNYRKRKRFALRRTANLEYLPVEISYNRKIDQQSQDIVAIINSMGGSVETQSELKHIIQNKEKCSEKYARKIINNAVEKGIIHKTKINTMTKTRGYFIS